MKFKKIALCFLLLIVLSGCKSNADIEMKSDGTIDEKVVIYAPTNISNKDNFIKNINMTIDNYSSALNLRGYSRNVIYDKETSKVELINSYDNICDYINNNLFTQYLYSHISCTEDALYYEIKNETSHIAYCSDCTYFPALDDVTINISLPIKAVESSADSAKDNSYTWKFNKDTPDDKEFYLKISKESIKENKIKENKVKKGKKIFSKILVPVFIVSLIIVGILILVKKYKSNKLEY